MIIRPLAEIPTIEFDENSYRFTIDLIDAALRELDFLKDIESHPELFTPMMMRGAIYRYEHFWLPLVVEHAPGCSLGVALSHVGTVLLREGLPPCCQPRC